MRHALHAFAVLDGAFIVREDGVVVAAGRYLNFDEDEEVDVPLGLGARHMAAAGISARQRGHRDRRLADLGVRARVPARQGGSRAGAARAPLVSPAPRPSSRRTQIWNWGAFRATMAPVPMLAARPRLACPHSSRPRLLVALVFGVVLGLGAAPARADDTQRAKELFQQGTTLFNLGEFDKAIDAWQQGYKEKPDPGFLYNIGQAYRLKGDAPKAIFFYRGYLRNSPKAANRAGDRGEDRGAAEGIERAEGARRPP